jgi:hypothetical protein
MIRLITLFAFLALFLSSAPRSFAAGVMQLKGTVVAFSKDEVTLEVRKSKLYILDRASLSVQDSAKIARAGDVIRLDVPLQSVKNVKEVNPSR